MPLTLSNIDRTTLGHKHCAFFDVAFDASYPTNGEALDLTQLGFTTVDYLHIQGKSGYIFEYDYTGKKIKVMYPRSASAVANSGANQLDVTTGSATASAVDTTTPTVTAPAGFRSAVDAQVADEVASEANLSGLTGVKVMLVGH